MATKRKKGSSLRGLAGTAADHRERGDLWVNDAQASLSVARDSRKCADRVNNALDAAFAAGMANAEFWHASRKAPWSEQQRLRKEADKILLEAGDLLRRGTCKTP